MDKLIEDGVWQRDCVNPNCSVIHFKWRKPGDFCPACRWV